MPQIPGEHFHPGRGTLSQSGMGNLLWSHLGKDLYLDDIDGLSRDATIRVGLARKRSS
ncbi:hypothetical protein [Pseudomonas lundensis]|nr:hypothetical protein [Pseudomonas lundensis]